jgi:hypothetical protein
MQVTKATKPKIFLLYLAFSLFHIARGYPWDDLALRCPPSSSSSNGSCAVAQQSLKECDALFGGIDFDEVLLRACRAAVWAEGENYSLQRLGTGTVTARWSSTPMGDFWFASASRADDTGLSATFEETMYSKAILFLVSIVVTPCTMSMTPSMSTLLHERLRPICQVQQLKCCMSN